jgi:flagellar export protein FliJ
MSALDSLIRVHRWQLDERRRYLNGLEELAARLRSDAQRLQEEAEEESRAAGLSPEAQAVYPFFIQALIERRQRLEASIAEVEGQILQAREAVSESFREVKRYELAVANRARVRGERIARREQRDQDGVALEIHRRQRLG